MKRLDGATHFKPTPVGCEPTLSQVRRTGLLGSWAAITEHHSLGVPSNRYLFSPNPGGRETEVKVSVRFFRDWSLRLADAHLLAVSS